ncbi:glycosyltransferase family 61 protein [Candidatus Pelagibacter ubique]|nr:glycosyltransferase family 61 protein [Candidatus Pelagibacter ubique]
MSKPNRNSIFSRLLIKLKIAKLGYAVNKGFPLEIRVGADKSIWLLSSYFLLKLSLKPRIILKKNLLNYTPKNLLKIFNRINPRCWELIEHSVYQKELSEKNFLYFPSIEISNYEIHYKHFDEFVFYKYEFGIIVEFKRSNFGGFGHLNMEIFPILVYLSIKLPLVISLSGLESQKDIFKSFSKSYGIKFIDSTNLLNGRNVRNDLIISKYGLKVTSLNAKYDYPNYNNICLMLNHLGKLTTKRDNYNEYIYIRRKENTSVGRRLDNEDKLLEQLIDLGFEIIYPEDYSFQEQICIFSNARIVIGVSGSALLNGLFCKKSSHIIELCPDTDFRPGVWLSTAISKNKYHLFLGKSIGDKFIDSKPEKFKINISLVIIKIKNIIDLKNLNKE